MSDSTYKRIDNHVIDRVLDILNRVMENELIADALNNSSKLFKELAGEASPATEAYESAEAKAQCLIYNAIYLEAFIVGLNAGEHFNKTDGVSA